MGAPVGAPKGPQEPLWERPWEPLWEPLWAHVGVPQEPLRAHVEGQVSEGLLPPSRNTLFLFNVGAAISGQICAT